MSCYRLDNDSFWNLPLDTIITPNSAIKCYMHLTEEYINICHNHAKCLIWWLLQKLACKPSYCTCANLSYCVRMVISFWAYYKLTQSHFTEARGLWIWGMIRSSLLPLPPFLFLSLLVGGPDHALFEQSKDNNNNLQKVNGRVIRFDDSSHDSTHLKC